MVNNMNIKTFSKTLAGITVGCSISFFSLADVVVHPSNDAARNKKAVKHIFLGKEKKLSNGKEVLPLNQVPASGARGPFDSDTLGSSSTQISAYWSN